MAQGVVKEFTRNDLIHVSLENDKIRVVFLPEIGGKMIELTLKETGRQYLLEPQNPEQFYKRAYYGANFEEYDTSGFDECFPTIEPSEHPQLAELRGGDNIIFPDHGELWALSWHHHIDGDQLILTANGIKFQYRFVKRIKLFDNHVLIDYHLKNYSDHPFKYIWSAHPLLKVEAGARLVLDKEIEKVFLNWASDAELGGFGDELSWPVIGSGNTMVDYSKVQTKEFGKALKCFTGSLNRGVAGIYHPDTDEHLLFHFDPAENPYLGIWLCYGGWPINNEEKHLTVGLEPASGRPDSLKEAINRNEYAEILAGEEKKWSIKMTLMKGRPQFWSNVDIKE